MQKIKFSTLLLLIATFTLYSDHPVRHVKQVILWGHKLHTHTHSYIHWGFKRAFDHLGYKTLWLDNRDNVSDIDFSNSLFITEGQVDQRMPVRDDCYYILHNCKPDRYRNLYKNGNGIILQVYTHDCLKRNEPSFDFCFHYDLAQPIIYMPWATDLLPEEINTVKEKLTTNKQRHATFVGTISPGHNQPQINAFQKGCEEVNIPFQSIAAGTKSMEDNITIVQNALLAPAIQGEWQCKQGYIPCRIFKNISYGAFGITNSETVYKLFNKKIVYNPDAYQLANDAIKKSQEITQEELFELMDFVRDHHTYLDRIERLFSFFEMVKENN